MRNFQKKIIKNTVAYAARVEIKQVQFLKKNHVTMSAFYFKCNLNTASFRRWLDLKKKVPLNEVKKSIKNSHFT